MQRRGCTDTPRMQYGNTYLAEQLARMRYEDARRDTERDALLERDGLSLGGLLRRALAWRAERRPAIATQALQTCTPERQATARRAA